MKAYAEIWKERQKIGHEEKARYVLDELYGCEKDMDSLFRTYDVEAEDDSARRQFHGVFDTPCTIHLRDKTYVFPRMRKLSLIQRVIISRSAYARLHCPSFVVCGGPNRHQL